MRLQITERRDETKHITAVTEHPQRFLGLARCRLQHQHHDAQMRFNIPRIQAVRLGQDFDPSRRRPVQRLPIGVITVGKILYRL